MIINKRKIKSMKNSHIGNLLSQYGENVKGILAVLVYKRRESALIEEIINPHIDEPQVHVNYSFINELIKNLKNEFGDDKDFLIIRELSRKKVVSCSLGFNYILITIASKKTSDIELKIYSTHIADEIERLEEETELESLSLKIPGIIKVFSKIKNAKISTNKLSLKVIVLGDYQVGKTSLINAFTDKKFKVSWNPTVGFNVYKKILNIDDTVVMNLAIWDTGGFSSQISPTKEKIFNFADAAIIVVDKTHQNILKSILKWYNEIKNSLNQEIPIFLAITKNDLNVEEGHLDLKKIEDFTTNYQIEYFLVSAKNRENMDELFFEIIYKIISLRTEQNSYGVFEEIDKYKGNYLTPIEINALKDLEHLIIESLNIQGGYLQQIGRKVEENGIPVIYEIDQASFGVKIEDGNVIGLGLFNCYLKTLPESIFSFKFLKKLNLRCNQLIQLPEVILRLESLEWLDLALTDLKTLSESIGNLKKLRFLYLENNSLITLPSSIGNLEFLQNLHLENNPIKSLPNEMSNLRSLEKLWLEAPTYFYKGALEELPEEFGDLPFLQVLDLSSCEIKYLPNSFGNLKSLRILDLSNNKLESLPDTFGNLKMLEILNIGNNRLKFLPDSIGDLPNLKQIYVSKNPLRKKASEKFKALALKSKGLKYKRLIKLSNICKQEEGVQKIEKNGISKRKTGNILKPLTYASTVAFLGLLTFFSFKINSQTLDITIWSLFALAFFINFLIGTCIIASISSYFKVSSIVFTQKIIKIFDILVILYFIWAIRAMIRIFLSIELIPSVNFLFEFSVPQWMLDFLVNLGYNESLTFLENMDIFFGHFYLKIFSIALVFWALYRNGFGHIRKTIFDEKANKNLWIFLIIGLFGALSLAIMNYSNLAPFLGIGYNIGVIIGSSLFVWEINKVKKMFFYYYLLLILGGIVLIWIISYWNILYSLIISVILIFLFFILRTLQHKKIKYYLY